MPVARAAAEVRRPGVEIAPRVQWPTALPALGVALKGRIGDAESAQPGRAVGRLSDLGLGPAAAPGGGRRGRRRPVPDDLLDAVVAVLAGWGWAERPTCVVPMPSSRHPAVVRSLTSRVASLGRLPTVDALRRAPSTAAGRSNSAQRVLALHDAFSVSPDAHAELCDAVVLLVDDIVDTGWTMTLAARALRSAGARAVLPLALALDG
jgi:ATP-dependent DNA helicase RecQ